MSKFERDISKVLRGSFILGHRNVTFTAINIDEEK
jgi:hypothetical protein